MQMRMCRQIIFIEENAPKDYINPTLTYKAKLNNEFFSKLLFDHDSMHDVFHKYFEKNKSFSSQNDKKAKNLMLQALGNCLHLQKPMDPQNEFKGANAFDITKVLKGEGDGNN